MSVKLKPPAFSLKKSAQGVLRFSESGTLLAQVTSKVVIWNVPERREAVSAKAISNEHYVAFHEKTQRLAIKNSNGELVFLDLRSGHVISQTGKFKEFKMGCQPWFLDDGQFLLDGGSGGVLAVYSARDSKRVKEIDLACSSVGDIASSTELFACLCGILGGCSLALVPRDLSSHTILMASDFGIDPSEWWEAGHLAFSPCGTRLAFTAKTQNRENQSKLFILDLTSRALVSCFEIGDDSHGWANSLSWSHDGHLALVFHENPWRQGMPSAEYESVKNSRDWESVHIFEAKSSRRIEKVYLPGVNRAEYRPGADGLALNCTQFPGAYLSTFRDLSAFAASKSTRVGRS